MNIIPHIGCLRSEAIIICIVTVLDYEEYLHANYVEYHPSHVGLRNLGIALLNLILCSQLTQF